MTTYLKQWLELKQATTDEEIMRIVLEIGEQHTPGYAHVFAVGYLASMLADERENKS